MRVRLVRAVYLTSPNPSIEQGADRCATTAFERNLLPGFAQWFVDQVERHQPDYIVPAETKGARVLETVLAYARDVIGTPVDVPVLYSTALAYVDPRELRGSRVMILDDAVRTGNNLRRHREKVREYGVQDVYALACIGYADDETSMPAVPCYSLVDSELYREYVWQLTELVVARGLPPEVDHHVFELRLPERLPLAWEKVERALAPYGNLSIDAPRFCEEDVVSMTLHFPTLPGVLPHPREGEIWNEGVSKVRLFPDPATESIYVVPVSFPALDLPAGTPELLPLDDAQRLIRRWAQREGTIGELLVAEADQRGPEMIFRALSSCTEVDLMCGLARVLARAFPEQDVSLTTQRELFHRLYGQGAGERIAARIDHEVRSALDEGRREAPGSDPAQGGGEPPSPLDVDVVDATKTIAIGLKQLYDDHVNDPENDPAARVGLSLTEVASTLGTDDMLLVSRSFDFGLAMTTLVPYVEVRPLEDGSRTVRRKYRVSEINRGEEPYQDIDDVNQELAEETVALIAHYLRTRSRRYAQHPIPIRRIGQLVAILRPLVLGRRGIMLRVEPSHGDLVVALRNGPRTVTLENVVSSVFALREGGVVPTAHFDDLYDRDLLRLDLRDYSTEIEGCLVLLLELLDDQLTEDELDRVLTGWAMSTDARFGLTHVRHALDLALDQLASPLKLILRDEPSDGLGAWDGAQARAGAAAASAKIDLLSEGWSDAIRGRWEKPSKRERQLLASFAAPSERTVFDLPVALADVTCSLSVLVERLAMAAARLWDEQEAVDADNAPAVVLAWCARLERTLTTMRDDDMVPPVPSRPREAVASAAEALLRIVGILRSFTAATAAAWRGWRGERRPAEDVDLRTRAVLFLDLSKSFDYALRHGVARNFDWKNTGLNLIGQWGKAFGGWEPKDREGDAIWLEFPELGDPAVLCAAMVQQHARALRSTSVPSLWWGFRLAIDDGQLQDGDGPNTIGRCLDRAAKLAKVRKEDEDSIERVLLTPDAAHLCSPALQDQAFLSPFREQVRLEEVDIPEAVFVPYELDAPALILQLCSRVREVAAAIAVDAAPQPAGEARIDIQGEEPDSAQAAPG